jgi:hypothetical protein
LVLPNRGLDKMGEDGRGGSRWARPGYASEIIKLAHNIVGISEDEDDTRWLEDNFTNAVAAIANDVGNKEGSTYK